MGTTKRVLMHGKNLSDQIAKACGLTQPVSRLTLDVGIDRVATVVATGPVDFAHDVEAGNEPGAGLLHALELARSLGEPVGSEPDCYIVFAPHGDTPAVVYDVPASAVKLSLDYATRETTKDADPYRTFENVREGDYWVLTAHGRSAPRRVEVS